MRGIIYCIKQKETGYDSPIYIGSTNHFDRRKMNHKTNYNNTNRKEYNYKVYQYIRENGGWDNFEMLEIGVIEYETEEELRIEEQKWIDDLGAELNGHRAYLSKKKHKELNNIKRKKYYQKYKEKIKEKSKEKIKCECGIIVNRGDISKHRKSKNHIIKV